MTRRAGMTMTEVLVAIFIVAIGLAGVMSMVPFGAKQMSDALTADRATTHGIYTEGLVRSYWKQNIADVVANGGAPTDPFWVALEDPSRALPPDLPAPGRSLPVARPNEPSYPVFLDPMGVVGRSGNAAQWVGDNGATSVPRRNMNLVGNRPDLALRMWSQPDGFAWNDTDGADPKPGFDMRELRYNSLAVIQRPTNRERLTATLKVVVFTNRRHQFFPNGSEAVFNNVSLTPGQTALRLPTAADVKKGSWIMDATVTTNPLIRHANFYRVVSATEDGTTGQFDIELASPVRRVDALPNAYTGTVVVMPGAAAVFEYPALTGTTAP